MSGRRSALFSLLSLTLILLLAAPLWILPILGAIFLLNTLVLARLTSTVHSRSLMAREAEPAAETAPALPAAPELPAVPEVPAAPEAPATPAPAAPVAAPEPAPAAPAPAAPEAK